MISFRLLHSHLKLLSNNDLKGTRIEYGFKRAFTTLFGQDLETFTGTMFLNMDQFEKLLDNKEFQEIGSMASFKILEFRDILIQHMEYVKKSIDERALHKREYDTTVNERQMQTKEGKVDTCKALDDNIRPIYDEEPMAEVQTTAKINVFATGQQHTEQPEFNNEGEVDQNAKQCHDTCPLPAKLTDNQITELSYQSLESGNIWKPILQLLRNQSVVRQPIAFKSERTRISKPRFASQVDVNNDLPKPATTHYLPKERESVVAKPHLMIAPSSSRNFKSSVMPSARSQSTANGSKPKPRINNQKSRNWHASKSSCVTTNTVPIAEHSRNSRNFFDSKHFVCSTCQKCVFNANHDNCVTKFLNEVNSCAKVPSNKTTTRNKPVEQTSFAIKPKRQIPKGHRFSIKKTFVVHEKTMTPRSCLRWKPTGKFFKTVGLRWVPTGKIFTSSTTKVDSEPPNGLNEDITNLYECEQTLNVSVGTLNLSASTSFNSKKEGLKVWLLKRLISQKLGLQGILI
ncbi:hypothetical protein Tco_0626733 [Tanacetum coccineum]|uniref:Uncharacterized protein n=1 Tax=Tanacetum coccineum TaxID=301880 RepID=A0ABQ4WLA6_9ASTR